MSDPAELEAAMATQSRKPAVEADLERGLLGQIEVHSIDWIPDTERHGRTWQQAMLWFLGNFQYFTIYTVTAILYFAVCYPSGLAVRSLEDYTRRGRVAQDNKAKA